MHGKKIISNSAISLVYKVVIIVLGFVTRGLFIHYLGEELLGLSTLYATLLDLLNLADLGLGVALMFQLYEPLVRGDVEKQSRILTAARKIYSFIGLFILAAGIILSCK